MLFFGFEFRKLKKSCILQEENSWLWELGVMEIVQESATLPWEGLFGWAFIWLLCLDASRIQTIPISGIQVENSWSRKQPNVDYPFRGSTHTRHFSVGFLLVTSERILTISLLCFILQGGKMQQRNSCSHIKKQSSQFSASVQ